MLQVKRVSQITLLYSQALEGIPGVVHAFSTRRAEHNAFTLGPAGSDNPAIQMNRARFLSAAGMAGWPVLKLRQVHSAVVHAMADTGAANTPMEGDAAVTGLRGAALGVQSADCTPILLADKGGRAVGAVHAGWRGTAARVAFNTVLRMTREYGIEPSALVAVIGPHNAVCCYEVGDDVVAAVGDPAVFEHRPGQAKPHFNQALANQKQLIAAGVPESQIFVSTLCTHCREDLFYSYRREGESTGRLLAVIGIAP
jgi:YfiH family protein